MELTGVKRTLASSLPAFHVKRHASEPHVYELVDRQRRTIYRKIQTSAAPYESVLEDALFGAVYSTTRAPTASAKEKEVTLHDPESLVRFSHVGRMSYTWRFKFEDEIYEWRQPLMNPEFTLWMVRKPDPDVDVCRGRPADSKGPASITLHSYNLRRFEVEDGKGLEILMISTFLSFLDAAAEREGASASASPRPSLVQASSSTSSASSTGGVTGPPPPPPPKDLDVRDELGFGDYEEPPEPNEVVVRASKPVTFYAQKAFALLNDPNMLFVIVRANAGDVVQKAVLVAEETKRLRHQRWEEVDGEEIHQYVVEDDPRAPPPPPALSAAPSTASSTKTARRPPKVINLDAPAPTPAPAAAPPPIAPHQHPWDPKPISSLSIYLSKIPLPDLAPKPKTSTSSSSSTPGGKAPASSSSHSPPRPTPASTSISSSRPARPPASSSSAPQAPPPPSRHQQDAPATTSGSGRQGVLASAASSFRRR